MAERARAAIIDRVGDITTLGVKDIEISQIPENFVVIRTEFASTSPGDELLYKGSLGFNFQNNTMGLQGSGTVIKSGGSILANSLLNKRVSFLSFSQNAIGSFSELALTDADFVVPIKDDLSFEDAASAFTALTVEYIMRKIRRGNHRAVIQNAAASSIGKSLIKYCNHYGIDTINIVRREDQAEILRNIGAQYVVSTSEEGWKDRVRQWSKDFKATVAFDAIAGEMTGELYEILQEPGKLYVYGYLSEKFCSINPLILDTKKKIRGLSLGTWLKNASTLKKFKVWNKVQELYAEVFRIDYKETIGVDRLKDALSAYKDRKTNAKVLVRVRRS